MTTLASKRYLWFAISLIVIVPGVVSLLLFGLRQGIGFTGSTAQRVGSDEEATYLIRMKEVREGSPEKAALERALEAEFGPFVEREFSTVGASVGEAIRNRAIIAVLFASVGILL